MYCSSGDRLVLRGAIERGRAESVLYLRKLTVRMRHTWQTGRTLNAPWPVLYRGFDN